MQQFHPLRELLLCRLRLFWREADAVFWTYGFPILMTIGLGIAFRTKPPEQVRVDIVAGPNAEATRAALVAADSSGFAIEVLPEEECRQRLRRGRSDVVIRQDDAGLAYRFDPARPECVLARAQVDHALQRQAGRGDVIIAKNDEVSEPGSRYVDFLVPGLLGMNLMGGGLWGVGFVTVDMRVRKLLKRLVASPMRRRDLLLSLFGGRMLFTIPEISVVLVVAALLFRVQVTDNLAGIIVVALIGAMSFAGLGLLTACRAERMETIMGLMNVVMLPMWLLSGVFFSYERFPEALHPFIRALPLTQLNDALRAVILDGASLGSQWFALGYLAAIGVVSFVLALRWFKWT